MSTRQPLTAEELRAEVSGNTFAVDVTIFPAVFDGYRTLFIAADGVLYGRFTGPDGSTTDDVGRWHITLDGQFCRTWHVREGRREGCYTVYRQGETFAFSRQDRFAEGVLRRVPGNPEAY